MYYRLRKLGFGWGRITRKIASGRMKLDVLKWLRAYATRRVARFNTKVPQGFARIGRLSRVRIGMVLLGPQPHRRLHR